MLHFGRPAGKLMEDDRPPSLLCGHATLLLGLRSRVCEPALCASMRGGSGRVTAGLALGIAAKAGGL